VATIITDTEREIVARADDERLLADADSLAEATGWVLKPEGLCRGDVCVPVRDRDTLLAGQAEAGEIQPDRREIDLAAFAVALGRPYAIDVEEEAIVLGEPASTVVERLRSLEAPDVTLADLDGAPVALSEYAGRKRILVTWASWCGCRYDLPAWQALHEELAPEGLELVSISLDNEAGSAREWVDAAQPGPTFPVLIDPHHRLAELYGVVNVPSVVWIDEDDHVVRSPVIAPGDDMYKEFTKMDSTVHHEQLRHWVRDGVLPEDDQAVRDRQDLPGDDLQLARAERRLGAWLHRAGRPDAARKHLERATALAPLDFTVRRGSMPLQGQDPFGQEFFDFWEEWDAAGRPNYRSAETTP
jgi:peroxiredoxin